MQLEKGMYGTEFKPLSRLFGLRCGQMGGGDSKIAHNGGWYNARGEFLGWGDLTTGCLLNVSREIAIGETFIVISEGCWRFRYDEPDLDYMNLGSEFVAEHADYIVKRGQLFKVERYDERAIGTYRILNRRPWYDSWSKRIGVPFLVISPEQAKAMLLGHPS